MSRLMIAGTGSGCGKTTVVCGILRALAGMSMDVMSFKSGPDYIDPMFHKKATGVNSKNLDIFLMGEENVRNALAAYGGISLIEGAMGIYDGVGSSSYASANHLALITETPTVLVVNAKGKSASLCAEVSGYLNYEENCIKAVILNNVSERMYSFYKDMLESRLDIKVSGYLPGLEYVHIPSRHLGLVTAGEIADIQQKLDILAEAVKKCVDLDFLVELAKSAKPLLAKVEDEYSRSSHAPKIYVSEDEAFCFYYEDNHEILRKLGAELCFFSPLHDTELPSDADGLILWGGYPELYAEQLSANISMKESINRKIKDGMPVYGECGGFMYLQEKIIDLDGRNYEMLGALQGEATMTRQLQNFGYVELTALRDNILCKTGDKITAHSFHHSVSTKEGDSFLAVKKSGGKRYSSIQTTDNIFAGYPHIHFLGNAGFALSFVNACVSYCTERRKV